LAAVDRVWDDDHVGRLGAHAVRDDRGGGRAAARQVGDVDDEHAHGHFTTNPRATSHSASWVPPEPSSSIVVPAVLAGRSAVVSTTVRASGGVTPSALALTTSVGFFFAPMTP